MFQPYDWIRRRNWLVSAVGLAVAAWFPATCVAAEPDPPQPIVALEVRGEPAWQEGEVADTLAPIIVRGWGPTTGGLVRDAIAALGKYRDIQVTAAPADAGVRLLVELRPKLLVSRVTYRGNKGLAVRQLEQAARMPVGTPVDDEVLKGLHHRLIALYRNEGFPDAEVKVELIEGKQGDAEVMVSILEGTPRVIHEIEWTGLELQNPKRFLSALPVRKGQRWTNARAKETERAAVQHLRRLGYYEARVDLVFEQAAARHGVLRLAIRPGPKFQIVFEGNRLISQETVFTAARIWDRALITDGTWRQVRRVVEQLYQERGHYLVSVSLDVERPLPGEKLVRITVDEGPLLRVRRVEFEGQRRVAAKRLREVMVTGPPSWLPWRDGFLVPSRFQDDLKRLWFRYRELGFADAEITDYRIAVERSAGAIDVTIVVDEGTQLFTESIDFVGLPAAFRRPSLREVRVGRPLDPYAVEREADRLARALRDDGFAEAAVEGSWQVLKEEGQQRLAAVKFNVHPGPRYHVGRILVAGNIQTASTAVRRESRLQPGTIVNPQVIASAQNRLYQLGLFRSVEVDVLPPVRVAPEEFGVAQDVSLRVQERAPFSLTFGGGYNTRDGFRAFGEVAHLNLAHKAERLGLRGDIALDPQQAALPNEYLLDVGFRDPQLLDTGWAFRLNAIGQRATRSVDQFSIERLALVPAIERRWLPALLTGIEFEFEQARIFDLRPDARAFNPADEGRLATGSFGPFVVYEGRDDPFMPRKGVFDSVRLRLAPAVLGSDVPLTKVQWHHSHYVPLGRSLTWLYAIRGGWTRTLQGGVVPIRERFFLGGRSTVRGFSENSIGPLGAPIVDPLGNRIFAGGNPLGGDLSLNLNTELRFPLVFGAIGAAFVDGGGVYLQDRSVSLADFRRSAGLGVLYETPIGPLALHYGVKLDRRPGEAFGAVHFTIGTVF